jgi:predicted RNase H-like HicB family nuclease
VGLDEGRTHRLRASPSSQLQRPARCARRRIGPTIADPLGAQRPGDDILRTENGETAATVSLMAGLTFNVVFEDAGDGWVYAHVPELPEVHTQGETLDQAREMVKDAIALVLDERRNRGEAIPPTGWALVESVEIAA